MSQEKEQSPHDNFARQLDIDDSCQDQNEPYCSHDEDETFYSRDEMDTTQIEMDSSQNEADFSKSENEMDTSENDTGPPATEEETTEEILNPFKLEEQLLSELIYEILQEYDQQQCIGMTASLLNGHEEISPHDFRKLKDGEYLNDSIINAYLQMIAVEANAAGQKIHMFNSYFMTSILNGRDVSRQLKRAKVFDFNYLIIPINDELHWSAVVVDFQKQWFLYCDSINFTSREQEELYTRKYIVPIRKALLSIDPSKRDFFQNFPLVSQNRPNQTNSIDCGVFLCQFVKSFCRKDMTFPFCQDKMFDLRLQMAFEILSGKLLP